MKGRSRTSSAAVTLFVAAESNLSDTRIEKLFFSEQ